MLYTKRNKLGRMLGLLAMALLILLLFAVGGYSPQRQCYAAEDKYTGVLEDLYRAQDFDKTLYTGASDQTVRLIQIAVGVDHELFVYTYEPDFDYTFSEIVFNTETEFEKIDFRSYRLQCVDNAEGFFKYVVKDYKVPERTHSYAISKLFYPVQNAVEDNNKVTYEYIPVEQIFTVTVTNGVYTYSSEVLKTITVTDKYVGHGRRFEYYTMGDCKSQTQIYFIAFNTDVLMEDLLEAQIEYWEDRYDGIGLVESHDPNSDPINVVISSDQSESFTHDTYSEWWYFMWKSGEATRTFDRISKPEVFTSDTGFDVPKASDGEEYDWVVTFKFETREYAWPGSKPLPSYPVPANTSILRLKFETNGVTYNLGVLDNRASYVPSEPTWSVWSPGGWPWWVYVVLVVGVIVAIIVLPYLVKLVIWFIHWIVDLIAG